MQGWTDFNNFIVPFYLRGSTVSKLQSHYEKTIYVLPISIVAPPLRNVLLERGDKPENGGGGGGDCVEMGVATFFITVHSVQSHLLYVCVGK